MKLKTLIATAAVAAGGALFTVGTADAAQRTATKVTIQAESGGFFGFVKSADAANCADGRKVILREMVGETPNPKVDPKILTDDASLNGTKYQWNSGNPGLREGQFYAQVRRTAECRGDLSRVISAQA